MFVYFSKINKKIKQSHLHLLQRITLPLRPKTLIKLVHKFRIHMLKKALAPKELLNIQIRTRSTIQFANKIVQERPIKIAAQLQQLQRIRPQTWLKRFQPALQVAQRQMDRLVLAQTMNEPQVKHIAKLISTCSLHLFSFTQKKISRRTKNEIK